MSRARHFRAVRVRLECGCAKNLPTSLFRLTRATAASVVDHAARRGVWCFRHGGTCQPVEVLGVVRL